MTWFFCCLVPENAERGYVITELRAEDEDFGPNGELVFYIENAQLDIFTIEGEKQFLYTIPNDRNFPVNAFYLN